MNINIYLENLQESELKDLKNISLEKSKKLLKDIKSTLDSNNINKLKSITNPFPKIEFSKIEKYAKNKISGFNSLYLLSEKVLLKILPVKTNKDKKGIKVISTILVLISVADKNPKSKLRELLNKVILKSKNQEEIPWDIILVGVILTSGIYLLTQSLSLMIMQQTIVLPLFIITLAVIIYFITDFAIDKLILKKG